MNTLPCFYIYLPNEKRYNIIRHNFEKIDGQLHTYIYLFRYTLLTNFQLLLLQLILICPLFPVRGLMLLILTMPSAKALKNSALLVAYFFTRLSVELPILNNSWSEWRRAFLTSKFLKYRLSK